MLLKMGWGGWESQGYSRSPHLRSFSATVATDHQALPLSSDFPHSLFRVVLGTGSSSKALPPSSKRGSSVPSAGFLGT